MTVTSVIVWMLFDFNKKFDFYILFVLLSFGSSLTLDLEVLFSAAHLRAPASPWALSSSIFFLSSASVLSSLWFVFLRAWAVRFLRFSAPIRRRIPFVLSQICLGSSSDLFSCCRFFCFSLPPVRECCARPRFSAAVFFQPPNLCSVFGFAR
jgi:hypothetical protein